MGAGGSGGYSDTEVTVAGVGGGDRYYRDPYVEGPVGPPRYHHASGGGAVGGAYGADPTGKPDISSFFLPSAFQEGQGVVFIVLGKTTFVKLFIVAYTSPKEIPGHLLLLTMHTG